MKVKDIVKSVKTVSPDSSVKEAAVIMDKYSIGSLVVVNEEKELKGIITEKDILQKVTVSNKLPSKVLVKEIMSKNIVTIDLNAHLDDACYLMVKHKIKKLPVTENNSLVGIISSADIVANSSEIGEDYLFD